VWSSCLKSVEGVFWWSSGWEKKGGNIPYWFALGTFKFKWWDLLQTSIAPHARCAPVSINSLFFLLIPVHKVIMRNCTMIMLTKTCACLQLNLESLIHHSTFFSQPGSYETSSMRSPWTRLPLYPLSPPSSTNVFIRQLRNAVQLGKSLVISYARSRWWYRTNCEGRNTQRSTFDTSCVNLWSTSTVSRTLRN